MKRRSTATMGGQQGDTGVIKSSTGEFKVEETIHLQGEK
jgi:alanyl-tRNA synthetase